MIIFSVSEAQKEIDKYFRSADKIPYFVAADGGEYLSIKNKLAELPTIRVGSFCFGDTFPDFDNLCYALETFNSNALCLGLGEAILLSGDVRIVEKIRELYCKNKIIILNPAHWRYYLRGFIGNLGNRYLKFAFERFANFDEYARNIFFALLELDKDDKNFPELYGLRKEFVKNFDETFLNEYISTAQVKGADAVYYLTDNTAPEICAAIEAVQGFRKIPDALLDNFPAFEKYLGEYKFADGRLTDYFRRYKKILA